MGGNSGSLKGGHGVAGVEHHQLWPKCGKLLVEVGVAETVHCQGIRSLKRCVSCPSRVTGLRGGTKRNGGNHIMRPQCTTAQTARRQGGRSYDGDGGQRAGQFDSPLHAE